MNGGKQIENFLNQIYKIINDYSKQSAINYKDYLGEISENIILENFQTKNLKRNSFLIYSIIHQIEFIVYSNKGQNNQFENIKYLIENCFYSINDVNENQKSVISYCFELHNKEIYNYLLSKQKKFGFLQRINKPDDFEPNIFNACIEGKITSVQWLIEKEKVNKSQRDVKGDTPIHIASERGHLSIVEYLIEKQNVNIEIKGNNERTPLHYACKNGYLPIVEYLIFKGANIDAEDENDWTPLLCACNEGYLPITEYLISKGANIEAKDKIYRETPLHDACENGNLPIVEYLLSKGANIESKDRDEATPLHYASYFGYIDIVKCLISKGANKNAINIKGKTPYDLAANDEIRILVKC